MTREYLEKEINEICYLYHDISKETKLDKVHIRTEKFERNRDKLIDKILDEKRG